jgi:SNF2 family DNA or RNA helicase
MHFRSYIGRLKDEGRKVLIFSHFVSMLTILEDYLKGKGWSFSFLDGSTECAKVRFIQ